MVNGVMEEMRVSIREPLSTFLLSRSEHEASPRYRLGQELRRLRPKRDHEPRRFSDFFRNFQNFLLNIL